MTKIQNKDQEAAELEVDSIQMSTIHESALTTKKEMQVVKTYYKPVRWKNVKTVYRCETCGHCRDEEDDIILHVIDHVDSKQRDALFNELVMKKGK